MAYLHGLDFPIIHRDLKSGNLLVADNWTVKVADFGTSALMDIHVNTNMKSKVCTLVLH